MTGADIQATARRIRAGVGRRVPDQPAQKLKAGMARRIAERPVGLRPLDQQIDRIRSRRPADTRPLAERVAAVPNWFHSIDLGGGIVTPGIKTLPQLGLEWHQMRVPDLGGRSVLDIGAWDGYFSFAAERAGAASVVALDHYSWSIDWAEAYRYGVRCQEEGRPLDPWHLVPSVWKPWRLPGRQGFEVARDALGSKVRPVVGDIATTPPGHLGTFDVVLFLGVLYHMEDPLGGLRRVADVTAGMAVIETEAIALHGHDGRALFEFFPHDERGGDPTNWWAPTAEGLLGLCRAAGFRKSELVLAAPEEPTADKSLVRYRLVVHAWR